MAAVTETFKNLVINSMDDLGLYFTATLDANTTGSHDELSMNGILDISVDDEKMRWWYIADAADLGVYRLIESTTVTADGKIKLSRGFPAQVNSDAVMHLFLTLSPREARRAVNNALKGKFLDARAAVTLALDTTEYNLTATIADLTSKGQLKRIIMRDISAGSTLPQENPVPVQDVFDDDGEVKLILPSSFDPVTSRTLQVEYRKYYAPLSADADTINISGSELLIRTAVRHEMLKMIFQKMGPAAKRHFGQGMVLTEKELAEEETKHLSRDTKKDLQTTRRRLSGDPSMDMNWSW